MAGIGSGGTGGGPYYGYRPPQRVCENYERAASKRPSRPLPLPPSGPGEDRNVLPRVDVVGLFFFCTIVAFAIGVLIGVAIRA